MSHKIVVQPISEACECPFYVRNAKGKRRCFIKQTTSLATALALVEENADFDPDIWEEDCGGTYNRCAVIPLLYNLQPQPPAPPHVLLENSEAQVIENYNPFAEENEEAETQTPAPALPSIKAGAAKQVTSSPATNNRIEAASPEVRVKIAKVADVYRVKCDVLVYPTNQLLVVDAPDMDGHSKIKLQRQCDAVPRPIELGQVYTTGNGDAPGIRAPRIYHAVCATETRLVNPTAITKAVTESLMVADANGARVVAMLACDCGGYDIYKTALTQLSAIKDFLSTVRTSALEHIFVIMQDDESLAAFEQYFDRIFAA